VTEYRIYADSENNRIAAVPAGQLSIGGISGARVFVSAFNSANGLESVKASYNSVVHPGMPVLSGAHTHREIQAAIDALPVEGGEVWLASGDWFIGEPITIPADKPNVRMFGSGDSTCLRREQNMPTGLGVINVHANSCELRNFKIDGLVITAVGITYTTVFGALGGDPLNAALADGQLDNHAHWRILDPA
jgi:hypothetical protein